MLVPAVHGVPSDRSGKVYKPYIIEVILHDDIEISFLMFDIEVCYEQQNYPDQQYLGG